MINETIYTRFHFSDIVRSQVHERLEWWLAQAQKMSFRHLVDGIYRAGVASGVYLSKYQRPINAVPGLRAKPLWEAKETKVKKELDKIRENWKVIRDEGNDLMKDKNRWSVDPAFNGIKVFIYVSFCCSTYWS